MLTLAPGCACDVCAEEYGPQRLPHSIPCGHVLCASCCQTIVEKTSPRLSPACPFCREPFTAESPRLIRMDFTTSGWSTPRRFPAVETFNTDLLQRKTERLLSTEGGSRARIEVRRLEDKVARVAAKKCSVEEVSSLYKELEEWLLAEKDDQTSSLFLSAALLRAILMNHLAHSEASKAAKTSEANLKNKIDDLESGNAKLEAELRRQRTQYTQKSQECQQLRHEISQLRALATTLGGSPSEIQPSRSLSPTPHSTPSSASTSPTPYSSGNSTPMSATPISRFNSMHSQTRSASMSSRPTTPATPSPTRSHTPAPPSSARSHTPAPRSHTPGPTSPGSSSMAVPRSHTPAPPMPSLASRSATPSLRSYTPGPSSSHHHSHSMQYAHAPPVPSLPRFSTPAPSHSHSASMHRIQTPAPLVPPKPRRLSTPSPPKMGVRSASEEKAEAHERWIPPQMVSGGHGHGHGGHPVVDDNDYPYASGGNKTPAPPSSAPARPASRMGGSFTARLRSVMG